MKHLIKSALKAWRRWRLERAHPDLRELRLLEEKARRNHRAVRPIQARRRTIIIDGLSEGRR